MIKDKVTGKSFPTEAEYREYLLSRLEYANKDELELKGENLYKIFKDDIDTMYQGKPLTEIVKFVDKKYGLVAKLESTEDITQISNYDNEDKITYTEKVYSIYTSNGTKDSVLLGAYKIMQLRDRLRVLFDDSIPKKIISLYKAYDNIELLYSREFALYTIEVEFKGFGKDKTTGETMYKFKVELDLDEFEFAKVIDLDINSKNIGTLTKYINDDYIRMLLDANGMVQGKIENLETDYSGITEENILKVCGMQGVLYEDLIEYFKGKNILLIQG